jgi:hypothetical protein
VREEEEEKTSQAFDALEYMYRDDGQVKTDHIKQ